MRHQTIIRLYLISSIFSISVHHFYMSDASRFGVKFHLNVVHVRRDETLVGGIVKLEFHLTRNGLQPFHHRMERLHLDIILQCVQGELQLNLIIAVIDKGPLL